MSLQFWERFLRETLGELNDHLLITIITKILTNLVTIDFLLPLWGGGAFNKFLSIAPRDDFYLSLLLYCPSLLEYSTQRSPWTQPPPKPLSLHTFLYLCITCNILLCEVQIYFYNSVYSASIFLQETPVDVRLKLGRMVSSTHAH